MKIGYACINSTLQTAGGVTTNRGMRQKTYNEKGLDYVSELALQNCRDLVTIVKWNEENGIKLFRMSSDLFPWMTLYDFTDLPDYNKIANLLKGVGVLAEKYNQRLTFHPSHFNALGSPNPIVVEKAIKDPVGGGILASPPPFTERLDFQFDSKGLSLHASKTRILT